MWFKVDDNFHCNERLLQIPKRFRLAAAGLWVMAGSWSANARTDGFVPDYMIQSWSPTQKQLDWLLQVGLWDRAAGGYQFRGWLRYNPSRTELDAKREASRDRMRKLRESRRNNDTVLIEKPNRINLDEIRETFEGDLDEIRETFEGDLKDFSHEDFSKTAGSEAANENVTLQHNGNDVVQHASNNRVTLPTPLHDSQPNPYNSTYVEGNVTVVDAGVKPPPKKSINSAVDDAVAAFAADSKAKLRQLGAPAQWSSPDDPRCRDHAGLPRDQVPPCGACAQARKWFEQRKQREKREHWDAINACSMCDDRGFATIPNADGTSTPIRCDHKTWPNSQNLGQKTEFQPKTTPEYRNELLSRLWGG